MHSPPTYRIPPEISFKTSDVVHETTIALKHLMLREKTVGVGLEKNRVLGLERKSWLRKSC